MEIPEFFTDKNELFTYDYSSITSYLDTEIDSSFPIDNLTPTIDREYLCRVYGDVSDKKIENLLKGVKVNNELTQFSDIVAVKKTSKSKNHWFYVCLFSGKNREVRKLWKTQKLDVNRLIRLRFGPILLPDNLKPGGWKKFSKKEVSKLKNILEIN